MAETPDAPEPMILVERRDDGVALLRLNNPKVNALCAQLLDELADAAEALAADPPGAVVITGGDKVFAAGADVSEFEGPEKAAEVSERFARAARALESIPRAVIAAIGGYALGGGCEVALACDIRIASDRAHFGQPEILLGIIPGGGGTQRLARLIGPSKAKHMIFSGRQVDAAEALAIGLVDEVVDREQLHERAFALAAELAAGAVVAQGLAKAAIDAGLDTDLQAGVAIETEAFVASFRTEDATIGLESFAEHGPGKAEFLGR